MDWLLRLNQETFVLFTLVFARVAGLAMTAPIYGTREVPLQIRGLLAFALAVLITPTQWHTSIAMPGSVFQYGLLIAAEAIIGVFLGLGVVFLLSGMQLAGSLVGRLGGFMLADVFDPSTNESTPLMGRLMGLLAVVVFVAMGGHRMVMGALLDTFRSLPPGSMASIESMTQVLRELVSQSFVLAVRAAAPVVVAVLASTLVLGLISRAVPQMNIMAVGLGVNSMLSLGLLAVAIGTGAMLLQAQVGPTMERLAGALGGGP